MKTTNGKIDRNNRAAIYRLLPSFDFKILIIEVHIKVWLWMTKQDWATLVKSQRICTPGPFAQPGRGDWGFQYGDGSRVLGDQLPGEPGWIQLRMDIYKAYHSGQPVGKDRTALDESLRLLFMMLSNYDGEASETEIQPLEIVGWNMLNFDGHYEHPYGSFLPHFAVRVNKPIHNWLKARKESFEGITADLTDCLVCVDNLLHGAYQCNYTPSAKLPRGRLRLEGYDSRYIVKCTTGFIPRAWYRSYVIEGARSCSASSRVMFLMACAELTRLYQTGDDIFPA